METPPSKARIPLALWPQHAPHPEEDYLLSILLLGDAERGLHYRWALHEGAAHNFIPFVFWRCVSQEKESSFFIIDSFL